MEEEKIIQEEPKRPKLPQELEQKFQTLEKDWQTYTHSSTKTRPKTKKQTHKFSSSDDCNSVHHQMSILDNSPRHLMSSLQHPTTRIRERSRSRSSPLLSSPFTITASGDVWRVRENELAKEEIHVGRLKGRRLFDDEDEVGFDGGDEIQSIYTEICGFGSFYGEGKTGEVEQGMLCFGEEMEKEVKKKKEGFGNGNGYRVKYVFVIVCLVIALLAFAIGMIGGIGDGFETGPSFSPQPT